MSETKRRNPVGIRRRVALAAVVLIVAAGLAVHFALPDTDVTDIAGDALYVAAVYAFVVVLAPRWPPAIVGALVLAWTVGIELFQLTGLPAAWGSHFTPFMLVLGTVFDARDLLVYAVAAVLVTAVDLVVAARLRARAR
ncbi:MAG: hypothetical protein ABS62_10945 [Microbacterium sp. SCN 70-200]|uniref:DUF2809 domain-containing protein n=1 Tax=unclassified Microbacterium TaxID=2609290 RepID=UPI00086C92FB|nr:MULTISPECIES: DUF2809 domain-containing protein [unclassified Microbacterium]ODT40214.1 MAG: hypothetical protein ABS62_10945 [Microbacterium sp. SCN 70-200]OJV82580.1 MAG: hypothetical protein BGO46_00440 [Microbacterium sp. 70-16]